MRRGVRWISMGWLLGLVACAAPGPAQRMAARLQQFEAVAGAPVESFHFWQLDRWEPLGERHVAVWTRVNEAYLIEVREPCSGLDFARSIALTSTQNRVQRRFDSVLFEHQRCRIESIRPVDGREFKRLARAG